MAQQTRRRRTSHCMYSRGRTPQQSWQLSTLHILMLTTARSRRSCVWRGRVILRWEEHREALCDRGRAPTRLPRRLLRRSHGLLKVSAQEEVACRLRAPRRRLPSPPPPHSTLSGWLRDRRSSRRHTGRSTTSRMRVVTLRMARPCAILRSMLRAYEPLQRHPLQQSMRQTRSLKRVTGGRRSFYSTSGAYHLKQRVKALIVQ